MITSIAGTDSTFRDVVLWLAGPYRLHHGWLERHGTKMPSSRLLDSLRDRFGVVPISAAHRRLRQAGLGTLFLDAWIERTGRWRIHGDSIIAWAGSMSDKCVGLLAAIGKPTDLSTLLDLSGSTHGAQNVRIGLATRAASLAAGSVTWF